MDQSVPIGERIVAIEFQVAQAKDLAQQAVERQDTVLEKLDGLARKMDEINSDIIRYKGFIGGVALVLTGIGIVATFFKTWIFTKLGIPA